MTYRHEVSVFALGPGLKVLTRSKKYRVEQFLHAEPALAGLPPLLQDFGGIVRTRSGVIVTSVPDGRWIASGKVAIRRSIDRRASSRRATWLAAKRAKATAITRRQGGTSRRPGPTPPQRTTARGSRRRSGRTRAR